MPLPEKFRESLIKFNIDSSIVSMIYDGYENITLQSPQNQRAAFFEHAMQILDNNLDFETKSALLESNACYLDGKFAKMWSEIAEKIENLALREKINKCNQNVDFCKAILSDNEIFIFIIKNWTGESFFCTCSQYTNLKDIPQISKSYCLCCAGNLKYHYQNTLKIKLRIKEVKSSPLNSSGKNPCAFIFEIVR